MTNYTSILDRQAIEARKASFQIERFAEPEIKPVLEGEYLLNGQKKKTKRIPATALDRTFCQDRRGAKQAVSLMPPQRDRRMEELDELIKAGRGDERPTQSRRPQGKRKYAPGALKGLGRYGKRKRERLEAIAADMRAKYHVERERIAPGTKCSAPGCERDARTKGRCLKHYMRDRRAGVLR